MEDVEEWQPVFDSFVYEVSNTGRIRKNPGLGKRIRSTLIDGVAYVSLHTHDNSTKRLTPLNRLVAEAFLDYPHNPGVPKPAIYHVDGDPLNCRADNLEWSPNA